MDTGHLSRPPGAFLESNDKEDQLALLNYVQNKKLKKQANHLQMYENCTASCYVTRDRRSHRRRLM